MAFKVDAYIPIWSILARFVLVAGSGYVFFISPSFTLLVAILYEFFSAVNYSLANYFRNKSKLSNQHKSQIFLTVIEVFAVSAGLSLLFSLERADTNWQLILATSLLVLGLKIFIQNREQKSFSVEILSSNFWWMVLLAVSIINPFISNLDLLVGLAIGLYLFINSFFQINSSLQFFVRPVSNYYAENSKEVDAELDNNKTESYAEEKPPETEVMDLDDEVISRLQSVPKVLHVYKTMVCKNQDKKFVSASVVVKNNVTQEDMFEVKTRIKKIFKRLGYTDSTVEIEYEVEFRGLV